MNTAPQLAAAPRPRRRPHGLAALLLLLPVLACGEPQGAAQPPEDEAAPTPTQATVEPAASPVATAGQAAEEPEHLGIDVSHYSGAVDWSQVAAAGYSFAFVKATEGEDNTDARFAEHWAELAEAGLPRGAYHFYVAHDDPEVQARFFLATVPFHDSDLLPVVDVESPAGAPPPEQFAIQLRRFLDVVEQETGVRPMIYTGPRFWSSHLAGDFADHLLWIAEYEVSTVEVPQGFRGWTMWQWEGDATVPGVEKQADVNRLAPGLGLDVLRMPRTGQ